MENNIKVGFEYEFYSKVGSRDVRTELKNMGIYGFETTTDASLYDHRDSDGNFRTGIELRFETPFGIADMEKKLKEVVKIYNNDVINPTHNDDDSVRGTTGIHFHFGIPKHRENTVLDLLRVAEYAYRNEGTIEELAARDCGRWARSMQPVVNEIDAALGTLRVSRQNKISESSDKFHYVVTRYQNPYELYSKFLNFDDSYNELMGLVKRVLHATKIVASLISNSQTSEEDENSRYRMVWRDNTLVDFSYGLPEGDTLKRLREFIDAMRIFKSSNSDAYLANKVFRNYEAAVNIFMYLIPLLNLDGLEIEKFRAFIPEIDKVIATYDMRNNHMDRAVNSIRQMDGFDAYISEQFTRLYQPRSSVTISSNWFVDIEGYRYDDNRYFGVNATNIGDFYRGGHPKINTVEFRWASSSIAEDEDKLFKYYEYLKNMYDLSFTGERTMQWGAYTLKDVTMTGKGRGTDVHTLAVFHDGKMIGRIYFDTLSRKINYGHNNKFNRYFHDYGTATDPFIRKMITTQVMRVKKNLEKNKEKFVDLMKRTDLQIPREELIELARTNKLHTI